MGAGWGLDLFGLGPYGGSGVATVAWAAAISTRAVEVALTGDARAVSELGRGDALNPASWRLTDARTGTPWTVLGVRVTQPSSVFVLDLLQDLGDVYAPYTLDASAVVSAFGGVPLGLPNAYTLAGVLAAPAYRGPAGVPHDLAVAPAAPELGGEVLATTGHGGYAQQSGDALLKKLIERRLTTTPGAYFHLPDYGLGLRAKRVVRAAELGRLQAAIEAQVRLEPDVQAARARLSLAQNVLTITLQVQSRNLGTLAFVLPIPVGT